MSEEKLKVGGLEGSSLSYFISKHFDRALLIFPNSTNLQEELEALKFFCPRKDAAAVTSYPAFESTYDAVREDPRIVFDRLNTQLKLLNDRHRPSFILTSSVALCQKTISPKNLESSLISIKKGEFLERDDFLIRLQAAGYVKDELAEDPGTMSVRGLLIDIFPPFDQHPLRLEFFGDELISLRRFDPETQRSHEELEEVVIPPCRELILGPSKLPTFRKNLKDYADSQQISREDRELVLTQLENHRELVESRNLLPALGDSLHTLLEYLPKNFPVVFINRRSSLEEAERFWRREDEDFQSLEHISYGPELLRASPEILNFPDAAELSTLIEPSATSNYQTTSLQGLRPRILGSKSLEPLFQLIRDSQADLLEVHLVMNNERRKESLIQSLGGFSDLTWHEGPLFSGFSSKTLRRTFVTERDIFGVRAAAKALGRRVSAKDYLREFSDLANGDFVVHEEHGLGKFRGLVKLQLEDVTSEFALIEYADADKLYLPIYRLDQISRYVPGDQMASPRLDKLGSQVFSKKKQKAREDIFRIAHELLDVAAKRKLGSIQRSFIDEATYQAFCNDFPHELTPDQESTLKDVEADLKKSIPMDRLICGDVGFGKTEVALRAAAFRALQGVQVSVLAPTTLLVEQHYRGFLKRFSNYGIKVARLSRFMTNKEQKDVLDKIKRGEVQIVIGTHRLLQPDIEFKNLGLVIVDEEQRFGVKHKERLKRLRSAADILTMSATPIPRTLQMAIVGIRELSLITTPPETRSAVSTHVGAFDKKLIRDACLRELQRSGQILFVHNRVQSIYKLQEELKKFLPEFRIAVGHGQMPEDDLEKVMLDFIEHRSDILLATSIIENGLDIPNANTIFVDHSEQFGLSDLYQIRGRVGRSHRKAFAYFLIHEDTPLTPEASKRLQVIQTCTELGSGFKVATHDLEIRGSGNLLGEAQSGVIAEVGLELYNEMLHECLAEIRHEEKRDPLPDLQSGYTAYIPESYIPEPNVRISTYRRFNQISNAQELLDFESELLDRFGLYPEEVDQLCQLASLRCTAAKLRAKQIDVRPGRLILEFRAETPLDPARVLKLYSKEVGIDPRGRLVFNFPPNPADAGKTDITTCRNFLKKLAEDFGV